MAAVPAVKLAGVADDVARALEKPVVQLADRASPRIARLFAADARKAFADIAERKGVEVARSIASRAAKAYRRISKRSPGEIEAHYLNHELNRTTSWIQQLGKDRKAVVDLADVARSKAVDEAGAVFDASAASVEKSYKGLQARYYKEAERTGDWGKYERRINDLAERMNTNSKTVAAAEKLNAAVAAADAQRAAADAAIDQVYGPTIKEASRMFAEQTRRLAKLKSGIGGIETGASKLWTAKSNFKPYYGAEGTVEHDVLRNMWLTGTEYRMGWLPRTVDKNVIRGGELLSGITRGVFRGATNMQATGGVGKALSRATATEVMAAPWALFVSGGLSAGLRVAKNYFWPTPGDEAVKGMKAESPDGSSAPSEVDVSNAEIAFGQIRANYKRTGDAAARDRDLARLDPAFIDMQVDIAKRARFNNQYPVVDYDTAVKSDKWKTRLDALDSEFNQRSRYDWITDFDGSIEAARKGGL